jgi:MFS transporter, ACS family, glucarate transporter
MPSQRPTRVRYLIVATLFLVSAFSYGDRIALSIAGISFAKEFKIDSLQMGYLFSIFSWAYVIGQLPSGGLLDRYGTKNVYGISLFLCSICALLVGFVGGLPVAMVFSTIMALRLFSGFAQSPIFPGNGRIVTAWFPSSERGRASAIFNSSQYFSLVLFAPLMGWLTHRWNWKACFWFLGGLGFLLTYLWFHVISDVRTHPRINEAEIELIESGGALTRPVGGASALTWSAVKELLSQRMLVGIYIGQFCINTLTWFFLTWFPIYLSQAKGMTIIQVGLYASLPAMCGFIGGILGGTVSDKLLLGGRSLTFARKTPIVIGMVLSMTVLLCNYVDQRAAVIALMSLAFFGKGFGALGWTLVSDTSPQGRIGLNGGLFNLIGNTAGITTPIIIGYLVKRQGSFRDALIFVGITALVAIISFLPLTGEIRRVELRPAENSST